jgi:uncharacterized protein YutE (UPF0331/DUF86 family)
VVLRPETIQARLAKLEEVIAGLRRLAASARPIEDAPWREWAAERGLQLGAETLLDIGNHILSAHFGVNPQDYEDIIRQLSARAVIPGELSDRLRGIGGFRNILVHDYLRVDPERVQSFLDRAPGDFTDFAAAIRSWLEKVTG